MNKQRIAEEKQVEQLQKDRSGVWLQDECSSFCCKLQSSCKEVLVHLNRVGYSEQTDAGPANATRPVVDEGWKASGEDNEPPWLVGARGIRRFSDVALEISRTETKAKIGVLQLSIETTKEEQRSAAQKREG